MSKPPKSSRHRKTSGSQSLDAGSQASRRLDAPESVLDVLEPTHEPSRKRTQAVKVKVAIVMGSKTDWPIMKMAVDFLDRFGVPSHYEVISAHRTPSRVHDLASTAHERGFQVIIAGAGGAAHLPGMLAAFTTLPVIGVPIPTKNLGGVDSLYSIVQMPGGVPVATVSIGGAENAAILALQILATSDATIANKLRTFKEKLVDKVDVMNEELRAQDADEPN